jgi:hypothetical protein
MISWDCFRTSSLRGQSSSAITPVQRLAVEDHLAACAACRESAALSYSFGALARTVPSGLRLGVIERAVARAVDEGLTQPSQPVRRRRMWIAIATCAAVGIPLVIGLRLQAPITTSGDSIVSGTIVSAGRQLQAGGALPADMPIVAETEATARMGAATVEMAKGSELEWMPARSTARLHAGRVSIAVHPGSGRTFRVSADRFAVEVIGTRFSVTMNEVRVAEGHVRVLDAAGVLLRTLGPNETWQAPADPSANVAIPERSSAEPPPVDVRDQPNARRDTAGSHLATARRHLAKREVAAARRELSAALALRASRPEQAEAATMLAECAFVDGDGDEAVRLYLAVADHFADLPAGESALFAAARLSDRAGRREPARGLLGRYLKAYPQGQFHREAKARLGRADEEDGR